MTPIDPSQLVTTVLVLLGVVGVTATVAYKKGKAILNDVTYIFINSNAAVQNGKLTPEQATSIINDIRDIAGMVGKITVVAPASSTTVSTTVQPPTPSTSQKTS